MSRRQSKSTGSARSPRFPQPPPPTGPILWLSILLLALDVLVFGESVSTMQMMLLSLLLIGEWALTRRRSEGQTRLRQKSDPKRSQIYRVELFFGHSNANGEPLRAQQIAEAEKWALESFSDVFHGAQLVHYMGGYQNSEGDFMIEPSTAIWSYTTQVPQAWLQVVANRIACVLEQECVLLCISTLDGTMTWIGQESYSEN